MSCTLLFILQLSQIHTLFDYLNTVKLNHKQIKKNNQQVVWYSHMIPYGCSAFF